MKHYFTTHQILTTVLAFAMSASAQAQTNVSDFYLQNWGFDTGINYGQTSTGNVAQEILDIENWTKDHSLDYTIVGTYAFGTKKTFNTYGKVPTEGYDGSLGCLAFSTGWAQSLIYSQTVTLPAGTYTIQSAWWNGSNQTAGKSLVGWIPNSGSSSLSTLSSFQKNTWTTDEQTFTLTRSTTGKIQIGFMAADGVSGNSAKVVLDYVKILMTDDAKALTFIRNKLKTAISNAKKLYGEGTGVDADKLKQQLDVAQTAYDDYDSPASTLTDCYKNLTKAIEDYNMANATESKPVDLTSKYLKNNSFESGTTGWSVNNLNTQTNTYFSKQGSTYLETWTDRGKMINDASVTQTIQKLPRGKYILKARGLHIQQSGANSTTNKGAAQTGAVLFAGSYETPITSYKTYSLSFSVVDEEADINIGAKATQATGNWFCIDYFQLFYAGKIDASAIATNLQLLIDDIEGYMAAGIQNSVRDEIAPILANAKDAVSADPLEESVLQSSVSEMQGALGKAAASYALYAELREDLDYAHKVLEWWRDTPRKATAWNNLETAIATAEEKAVNYDLTNSQIKNARTTLSNRVKAVDKKIYESGNAIGTGTALNDENNNWCYQRSLQSKHWILFWDKGYESKPSSIESILATADEVFELYANTLKFITINEGKSKTDTYKMIIRLLSQDNWEASGSGIDDQIGLLTLSRWAFTSRSGQTMAHEIGHCFQYQVHCDNGDWNGWMYNWGSSTFNVFWEMCAQWQAYKYYPDMQFLWDSGKGNDWFGGTINGLHRHPLSVHLRYNNYFIQDYMCHRHGMDFLGYLWNNSRNPEDPLQAYMRLTMNGTTSQKLDQLGDEMWEYGARMTTFDLDPIRDRGAWRIGFRNQTSLTQDAEKYWWPNADNCIENWGNNAIQLNVPNSAKTIYAEFEGKAGTEGYTNYNITNAGWKVGFVALQNDGTRVYSDITTANYQSPKHTIAFACPADCSNLWLVVSGAPTAYWTRDWVSWDAEGQTEQWPYRVYFYQTNVYGNSNDNGYPVGISDTSTEVPTSATNNVYSISGRLVRQGTTSLEGLPRGIYIVNGQKVSVR